MTIRFMTRADVPFFAEHGIKANSDSWTAVDVDKLSPDDRRGIVAVHRRILLVHEADEKLFDDLAASIKYEDAPKPEAAPKKK